MKYYTIIYLFMYTFPLPLLVASGDLASTNTSKHARANAMTKNPKQITKWVKHKTLK